MQSEDLGYNTRMIKKISDFVVKWPLELLFFVAAGATLTSLVLSNVLGYPPCDLCWYQRVFMFPLPFIYGYGLVTNDKKAILYGVPLLVVGSTVALYHNLLQWGIISEDLLECSYSSVSCADPIINWFGFLTIPFGALLTFIVLGGLSLIYHRQQPLVAKTDKTGANHLLWLAGGLLVATMIAVVILNSQ